MEECVCPNYAQSRCSVIFHGYIYPAAIHPTPPQVPSLADTVRSGSFSQVVAFFQLFKNKATTSACLWKLTLSQSMLGGWLFAPRLKFDPFQPICTTCTENLFETNRRKKTFHFCRTYCQSCLKHPSSPPAHASKLRQSTSSEINFWNYRKSNKLPLVAVQILKKKKSRWQLTRRKTYPISRGAISAQLWTE